MKLRNKKTGEIRYLKLIYDDLEPQEGEWTTTTSLAELNEEWEDWEEPKYFWFIDDEGGVIRGVIEFEENLNLMKQIGNYFETEEEAEEAVEKLKAWKRLKDKGFKFKYIGNNHIEFNSGGIDDAEQFINDMALIFGGEE